MLEFGGGDDGELGDHIVGWGADVLQSDEIGISLKVGHFAFGWHVKEGEFWGQVFEGFGAVEAQGCQGEGFVVEVSLVLVGDFEYHWLGGLEQLPE